MLFLKKFDSIYIHSIHGISTQPVAGVDARSFFHRHFGQVYM